MPIGVAHQGGERPQVGGCVRTEVRRGLGDRARDRGRVASVERMGEGDPRREQVDAPAREVDVPWKNGEAPRRGCTVEQTSWWNPGRVSSSVRHPPPGVSAPSMTSTSQSGAGQGQRGRQPVGARAHDDGVGPPHRASQHELHAVGGADHRHGRCREPVDEARRGRIVGAVGPVMEERDLVRPGPASELDRVVGRGVAEGGLGRPAPRAGGGRRGSARRRRAPARGRPGGTHPTRRARLPARSGSGRGCRRWSERPSLTRYPTVRPPLWGTSLAIDRETHRRRIRRRRRRRAATRRTSSSRAGCRAGWGRAAATSSGPARSRRPPRPLGAGGASVTRESGWSPLSKNGSPCMWSQCRWVRRMVPTNGRRSRRAETLRMPGARIEQEVGGTCRRRARRRRAESATQDVWPP